MTSSAPAKINVANPIVEMDGDEQARVMWHMIRGTLIEPYLDVELKYYDLSFESRNATDDKITTESAHAILDCNVGVKAATITATPKRLEEFGFTELYRSPNGTIRAILDGVVLREPIVSEKVPKLVTTWKSPIVIARHAFGDVYKATDFATHESGGRLSIKFEPRDKSAETIERVVHDFDGPGVAMGMFNLNSSIESFARGTLTYAQSRDLPVVLGHKSTILKQYDQAWISIFDRIARTEFPSVDYDERLIDDLVAYMMKNEDPVLYALKNYDGDVISDITAQGFGSLGLMTSVLVAGKDGGKSRECEAAHGTVTRHYRQHQRGEATSTNPVASIYAWTGGLTHRGNLDGNQPLIDFSAALEKACLDAISGGCMTKDLSICALGKKEGVERKNWATTEDYIAEVKVKLEANLK